MRHVLALLLVFSTSLAVLAQQRFDLKVREDMFAGFDGDTAAFDRAMKLLADTLAADPDRPEALTWRGAGRLFLAGRAFQRGANGEGMALASQGLADLNRGVSLKPDSVSTRAARGPALLPYAIRLRRFDKPAADRLTSTAISDFEFIVTSIGADWSKQPEHNRGELLGALADGWFQLGDVATATLYLDRMSAELPGTPYARNAAQRRADPAAQVPLTCLGCH
jgi:hypothetical protein